jgi:hypothetical protein
LKVHGTQRRVFSTQFANNSRTIVTSVVAAIEALTVLAEITLRAAGGKLAAGGAVRSAASS